MNNTAGTKMMDQNLRNIHHKDACKEHPFWSSIFDTSEQLTTVDNSSKITDDFSIKNSLVQAFVSLFVNTTLICGVILIITTWIGASRKATAAFLLIALLISLISAIRTGFVLFKKGQKGKSVPIKTGSVGVVTKGGTREKFALLKEGDHNLPGYDHAVEFFLGISFRIIFRRNKWKLNAISVRYIDKTMTLNIGGVTSKNSIPMEFDINVMIEPFDYYTISGIQEGLEKDGNDDPGGYYTYIKDSFAFIVKMFSDEEKYELFDNLEVQAPEFNADGSIKTEGVYLQNGTELVNKLWKIVAQEREFFIHDVTVGNEIHKEIIVPRWGVKLRSVYIGKAITTSKEVLAARAKWAVQKGEAEAEREATRIKMAIIDSGIRKFYENNSEAKGKLEYQYIFDQYMLMLDQYQQEIYHNPLGPNKLKDFKGLVQVSAERELQKFITKTVNKLEERLSSYLK